MNRISHSIWNGVCHQSWLKCENDKVEVISFVAGRSQTNV